MENKDSASLHNPLSSSQVEPEDGMDILTGLPPSPSKIKARRRLVEQDDLADAASMIPPPSFAQSEFETIFRRQRNNQPHQLKLRNVPTRFPNLDNDWEFAGWGSMSYLELSHEDLDLAATRMADEPVLLNQLSASSIAGNGVIGSVFYAFPAVIATSFIFSPLALLTACAMLLLFRPILLELGSAMRLNGANYTYLLQFSGKTMGLIGAAATLLDVTATSSVSAATASAYLAGEFRNTLGGGKETALTIGIILMLALIGMFSLRESSLLASTFTIIHIGSMAVLTVASIVAWCQRGTAVLEANWAERPTGASHIARAIFNGICLAFLGVTGFECTPTYIESIRDVSYPPVLRNLIIAAVSLNVPLMLLVYAILPQEAILGEANVLSLLAESVAGKWLRILVVVDCVLVVGGGGGLAGLVGVCSLLERLAQDRIIPRFFLRTLPTKSAYYSVLLFLVLGLGLYASSGFQLNTISAVFSVAFLFVLILYAVSNILLKFNRNRLPRNYRTGLGTTLIALLCITVVLIGNIVQSPKIIGLFLAYFLCIFLVLFALKSQIKLARIAMWIYDHQTILQRWECTRGWEIVIVKWMKALSSQAVVVWVKTDDIYNLVEAILYVRSNEPTKRIIFVHAYEDVETIPTELEANSKILDEAFPKITIDLVFLKGRFNPILVEATSEKLEIPRSLMFINSMGEDHGWNIAKYRGVRIMRL